MEYLPVEVISHILGFLPSLEDRKAASLVCKVWYAAYQSPAFRNGEVVEITSNERFQELCALTNIDRKYFHVAARNVEITHNSKCFWERFGPHIRSLSIVNCDIREKAFVDLIKLCLRLEALCIHNCRELLMLGRLFEDEDEHDVLRERLSHLKSLNLGYNRYLSDAIFSKFGSFCERIENLSLPGCHISFHSCLYRRFYSKNGNSTPSESVLTFPIIFRFIKNQAKNIRSLSFNETLIDSEALSFIAQTTDLSLESLHVRRCLQLTNDGILRLSDFQLALTHLDIALCPRITDLSLLIICSRLTKLKSLSVQGCRAVTDLGISDLWRLTNLIRLNISECELIQDEGIIQGLCTRKNPKLEELYLSHLGDLSDNSIVQMTDYLPNLRVLDLGYCYNAVTDRSVQSIFSNAKYLETLILTMCEGVTDRGLTGIALKLAPVARTNTGEKLMRIPLGNKAEIMIIKDAKTKQDVREICETIGLTTDLSGSSLMNLQHLQCINLSGCNRISDVSLRYAFKLPQLRSLDLSCCQQITSEGLMFIAANNKTIEILNLGNCQNVSNDGVCRILQSLKRLRSLTLGSTQITDSIVECLLRENLPLVYLDVRHCPHISAQAIAAICDFIPSVKVLYFSNSKSNDEFSNPPPPPHIIPSHSRF